MAEHPPRLGADITNWMGCALSLRAHVTVCMSAGQRTVDAEAVVSPLMPLNGALTVMLYVSC